LLATNDIAQKKQVRRRAVRALVLMILPGRFVLFLVTEAVVYKSARDEKRPWLGQVKGVVGWIETSDNFFFVNDLVKVRVFQLE
jgi:hypothetical protein